MRPNTHNLASKTKKEREPTFSFSAAVCEDRCRFSISLLKNFIKWKCVEKKGQQTPSKSHGILLNLRHVQFLALNMEDLNRIKVVLVEKKRTNKWLAKELDKDPATVSKWCTNSTQPDIATLKRIAIALDVDVRELLIPSKI